MLKGSSPNSHELISPTSKKAALFSRTKVSSRWRALCWVHIPLKKVGWRCRKARSRFLVEHPSHSAALFDLSLLSTPRVYRAINIGLVLQQTHISTGESAQVPPPPHISHLSHKAKVYISWAKGVKPHSVVSFNACWLPASILTVARLNKVAERESEEPLLPIWSRSRGESELTLCIHLTGDHRCSLSGFCPLWCRQGRRPLSAYVAPRFRRNCGAKSALECPFAVAGCACCVCWPCNKILAVYDVRHFLQVSPLQDEILSVIKGKSGHRSKFLRQHGTILVDSTGNFAHILCVF